jgi:hypothetical protein
MKKDTFWQWFWIVSGVFFFVVMAGGVGIFITTLGRVNAASVDITYDPNVDPFGRATAGGSTMPVSLVSGFLYQDSLLPYFKNWAWHADADWHHAGDSADGSYALRASFTDKNGGTVGMSGPALALGGYSSISISVKPDTSVGDLYLELYDQNGNSLGLQSLGWYASSSLMAGSWQTVAISLKNLGAEGKKITGFGISSRAAGSALIDAIQLQKTEVSHAVWVAPLEVGVSNPLLGTPPAPLPYSLVFTPEGFSKWYTYYGSLVPEGGALSIGPKPQPGSTGSMSVFKGGRLWKDYRVEATLYWGQTSAFSLLVRVQDDGNFISCAVGRYGEGVSIYQVKGGASTQLAQSPGLSVPDYQPWVDVPMAAEVVGDTVSCYVRGDKALSAKIPDMPTSGTAGVETWDQNPYASPHLLKQFSVTALTHD